MPLTRTVTPRCSSDRIISVMTRAPVASRSCNCDIRRMTTCTFDLVDAVENPFGGAEEERAVQPEESGVVVALGRLPRKLLAVYAG